jgi:hypothetical protein
VLTRCSDPHPSPSLTVSRHHDTSWVFPRVGAAGHKEQIFRTWVLVRKRPVEQLDTVDGQETQEAGRHRGVSVTLRGGRVVTPEYQTARGSLQNVNNTREHHSHRISLTAAFAAATLGTATKYLYDLPVANNR